MALLEHILLVRRENEGVDAVLLLTIRYYRQAGQWVGECVETRTVAQADTLDDVREAMAEAVVLQISEMDRLGCASEYLSDCGVALLQAKEVPSDSAPFSYSVLAEA